MKKYIDNINCYRDFVHIEDVVESINILIKKKFNKIVNISSGKKINLIEVCKAINAEFHTKKIVYGSRGGKDLFGNNTLLKSLGKKKFKNIKQIIKSFRK
jgi:nucleoside-diphosphate-sugar epimerase